MPKTVKTPEEIEEIKHFAKSIKAYMKEAGKTCYSLEKENDYIRAAALQNILSRGNVGLYGLMRVTKALNLEIVIKSGKIVVLSNED